MEQILKHINKWKGSPCSLEGKFKIIKMSILPNLIFTFSEIPIKISSYYVDINKPILKFMWKS